jgi:hypothetical protein
MVIKLEYVVTNYESYKVQYFRVTIATNYSILSYPTVVTRYISYKYLYNPGLFPHSRTFQT